VAESAQNIRYRQIRELDRHGTSKKIQMSDGLGLDPFLAKYNTEGSVTPSTLNANDVLTSPGGGTGLTLSGQGSWYGQIPVGPINGSNTRFLLDYTLANPWPALYLRGLFQWPFRDGDGSTGRSTAIADYDYTITGAVLTMRNPPQTGDRFYIEYFRDVPAPTPSTATSAVVHVLYSYIYGTPTLSNHGIVQLSDAVYFAQIFDGTQQTLLDKTISFPTLPAGFGTGGFPQNLALFGSIFDDLTTPDELRIYDYYAIVTYADATTARIYPTVQGVAGTGGGGISFNAMHVVGNGTTATYTIEFANNNPPSALQPGMLLRTIDFPTAGFNVTNAVITSVSLAPTSPPSGTITIANTTVGNEDWPATERNGNASDPGYYGSFANVSAAVDGNPATYATIRAQHYFPTRNGGGMIFTF
jgi:hypothetical protein